MLNDRDLILECPCGHQWIERVNLPMQINAFLSRAKGWLVCPSCGAKSTKARPILLLTGERYQQAAAAILGAADAC